MFITFEGPEGGGKSTVIRRIAEHLTSTGRDVVLTREPGAGEFGASVRKILLEGAEINSRSELFLFMADRANNIDAIIKPALEAGKVVLCDRHTDSTVAYQGYGRGLDIEWLKTLNASAVNGTTPHLTFLFDLAPEVGLRRISDKDRLDREPLEFHQKVRHGFLMEAALEPNRWRIINAEKQPDDVFADCLQCLMDALG